MEKTFSLWKTQCLGKLDHSKKSSVDEDIQHVVSLLNGCEQFFTTSSCSGRVILVDGVPQSSGVQKQDCVWLFVSHQKCKSEELVSGLSRSSADAVLKFEPFVLHVQCRELKDAQLLHAVAVNSGFRNSGLTVGRTGKILMAVRSTHGLEVPLSRNGLLLVDHEYIKFLAQIANEKMEENLRRIERFYQNLWSALSDDQFKTQQVLENELSQEPQSHPHGLNRDTEGNQKEGKNKSTVYKHRKKREQPCESVDHCHEEGSRDVPDLEDCFDLFS
ncbi:tRNA wybutosine-synthesizing protein 3 homolog [Halichoeres trimaculatus]|uniref:tRNA wybutosine-synthesizing protein 3 homolog n=1 Tax=Halichoeres trimaculatus TaxID=147232 RepID=UPI003D9ED16C